MSNQYLAESELILNPDGSIYHLNLQPEQLAQTVITVGDPDRVAKVSKHFDRIEHQVQKREFVTHTGYIGNKRLSVISTGIGSDNIDIVLNELDALANIDLKNRVPKEEHTSLDLIRIGTSGCMQKDIPVDSYLISAYSFGIDGLLHYYERNPSEEVSALEASFQAYNQANNIEFPLPVYGTAAGKSLVEKFSSQHNWHQGITVTAPGFYAPQARQLRLKKVASTGNLDRLSQFKFKDVAVTNLEMETAAIYGMAFLMGHQAISLNALIANRITGEFSANPRASVDKLIELTLETLAS